MRKSYATLTDATIRLKAANDKLLAALESTPPPRKSVPPSNPWQKAVVALTAPAMVRR